MMIDPHTQSLVLLGAMRGYQQACEFVASEFGLDLYPDLVDDTPPVAGDVLPSFAAGPSPFGGPSHSDGSHVTAPGLGDADPTPDANTTDISAKAVHQGMYIALRAIAEEFRARDMGEAAGLAEARAKGLKWSTLKTYS